ncbi:hypothetical protein MTP03_25050 [Tsukamurella sp. PLM1]|nr:hypothetical protein MTP03_25050 [Tsukamurella sp. PLM1]
MAEELTAHDPLQAHLDAELGIDAENLTSPIAAALSSAVAFSVGAAIPILASLVEAQRILAIALAVLIGLALTGYVSARLGGADAKRATSRVVVGGLIAMAVTYAVGKLLGTTALA